MYVVSHVHNRGRTLQGLYLIAHPNSARLVLVPSRLLARGNNYPRALEKKKKLEFRCCNFPAQNNNPASPAHSQNGQKARKRSRRPVRACWSLGRQDGPGRELRRRCKFADPCPPLTHARIPTYTRSDANQPKKIARTLTLSTSTLNGSTLTPKSTSTASRRSCASSWTSTPSCSTCRPSRT